MRADDASINAERFFAAARGNVLSFGQGNLHNDV